MKRYIYLDNIDTITVESIKGFIDNFKSGKLKPTLKSEIEPT